MVEEDDEDDEGSVFLLRMGVRDSRGPREGVIADNPADGEAVRKVPLHR